MKDFKGTKCSLCKKGIHVETTQLDDLRGCLHCNNCNNTILRYMKIDKNLSKTNIKLKIEKELKISESKKHKLHKIFTFSLEELQDTPDKCKADIFNYIDFHKEKIKNFSIDYYIDEEKFDIKLILLIELIDSMRYTGVSALHHLTK